MMIPKATSTASAVNFEYDFFCYEAEAGTVEWFNRSKRPEFPGYFDGLRPHGFSAIAAFRNADEARTVAAQFPKSIRMSVSVLVDGSLALLKVEAKLSADGNNKGTNEAGVARINSFRKHCARLGVTLSKVSSFGNSSERDFEGFQFILGGK